MDEDEVDSTLGRFVEEIQTQWTFRIFGRLDIMQGGGRGGDTESLNLVLDEGYG